eukprot:scaffold23.g4113.t1
MLDTDSANPLSAAAAVALPCLRAWAVAAGGRAGRGAAHDALRGGDTVLVVAIVGPRPGHLAAARVLLERSPALPAELIGDLPAALGHGWASQSTRTAVHALFADLAAGRALAPADWARFPTPTCGLARSAAEAAQLVAHLPAEQRSRLRALALSLERVQRQLGLELPLHIVRRILAAVPIRDEKEEAEE